MQFIRMRLQRFDPMSEFFHNQSERIMMKSVKSAFWAIMYAGFVLSVSAENSTAQKIALCFDKYVQTPFYSLDFTMNIHWAVRQKTEKKTGMLVVGASNAFCLEVGNDLYVSDGTTFWHYAKSAHQVVIKHAGDINKSLLPSFILKEISAKKAYSIDSTVPSLAVLTWEEKNGDAVAGSYVKLNAKFHLKNLVILSLTAWDKNGNVTEFELKNYKKLKKNPSEKCNFTLPQGVDVIDSRE